MASGFDLAFPNYHAHIYFDPGEVDQAREVAEEAARRFSIEVGRFHLKPIGPHPRGSCQLTVPAGTFGEFAGWMALNRRGLTVFVHANTGDDWADHTDHVIWFGPSEELRLDAFE